MAAIRQIPRIQVADWRTRARELGGEDCLDTPFRCPACGHVATPRDFKRLGAAPHRALQECVGRVTGAGSPFGVNGKPPAKPCDWAAFGLLGTLDGGTIVIAEDGTEVNVFEFAR